MSFVKLVRPTPSIILPVLWSFAGMRQSIYLRRVAGEPAPWTSDPVLSVHKFTNAYRASDRVSQYFIQLAYSDGDQSAQTLFLRSLLLKIFNKVETWERIVRALGMPDADSFSFKACAALLDDVRASKQSIYSGAYIMPSGGKSGIPKHRMHLALLRRMLDDDLPSQLQASKSLQHAYELLLAVPSFGPFLAFQYAIDLNYTTLMAHDESEFVVAGPGALDGMSKCFESLGDFTPAEAIRWLTDIQDEEFERNDVDFGGLWGRRLQPIDVQNLFCEVSKYTRVTHPEVKGRSGRTRIKQKFRSHGPIPRPFFPPKWMINDTIDRWMDEPQSARSASAPTDPQGRLALATLAPGTAAPA